MGCENPEFVRIAQPSHSIVHAACLPTTATTCDRSCRESFRQVAYAVAVSRDPSWLSMKGRTAPLHITSAKVELEHEQP